MVANFRTVPLRIVARPMLTLPEGTGSAWVAQLVERVLGKDEVTGSIPVPGSSNSRWGAQFHEKGGGNSTVESHSSKVMVAGSNPVPRSKFCRMAGSGGCLKIGGMPQI